MSSDIMGCYICDDEKENCNQLKICSYQMYVSYRNEIIHPRITVPTLQSQNGGLDSIGMPHWILLIIPRCHKCTIYGDLYANKIDACDRHGRFEVSRNFWFAPGLVWSQYGCRAGNNGSTGAGDCWHSLRHFACLLTIWVRWLDFKLFLMTITANHYAYK